MNAATLTLVGLAGGAGVGKDTIANAYLQQHGFLSAAFADEIKLRVIASGRATWEEVYVTKPPHVRKLLQEEGTERGRDLYGEEYWPTVLYNKLRLNAERWGPRFTKYVVTDVRFPNEVTWVQRQGGIVIRLEAPQRYAANGMTDEARAHRSERALDGYQGYDARILNDPEHAGTVGHDVYRVLADHGLAAKRDSGLRLGAAHAA